MYMKIWGLERLKEMGLPYPPYQVISINEDNPENIERYILEKIRLVNVPNIKNDRIGVTIRVSLSEDPDRGGHGGLHVTEEEEILKEVLKKHEQYKPKEKIILQHTVDAKCSGATRKENGKITIETIPGDAPPLLEGKTSNFESWNYYLNENKWLKDRSYMLNEKEIQVLIKIERESLLEPVINFTNDVYLEWSISKKGQIFYYEYLEFSDAKINIL
ncbi:hypothetical protein [Candidatus Methanoperedens nitratireducens]|uniref:Uncharacterized protein n=1 Tax=Candidatus Methanoperedens nitratireducens TaxID=1392998 RepID=A0A284VJ22_9EURY|nr:hypothetical protein [Candidatus Methanoperedens nitroreducens]SNQ59187.1 hypothetical protein MNV_110003 [Candidatus Methanoperedens nitroreducens]